ncbi:MAG TPA: carbon-nitrogen hydrolase family protein [Candidatus Baltobacterales bacterium]|nr:carbon-nitrogen hydrolase family protein [Candidatus Baltobacterales bacterium]
MTKKKKGMSKHLVAVVQHPPVTLDRKKTLERGVKLLEEAASHGARLVSFPEAWLPGYPEWLWRLRPGTDFDLTSEIHRRLVENAVDLEAGDLKPIQAAARRLKVTVSTGIHERDGEFSRGTLYNTVVLIGPDGAVLNRHRKLMPTNPERMVWGTGDAAGLRVIATPAGRVGSLICWENYMPLARFALFAQGCEVYVAPTWDEGGTWLSTMRHIAAEGRCWVLGNGCAMRGKDIPRDFPQRAQLFPDLDGWYNAGDSVIVEPGGSVVAGPLHEQHGILYADCDPATASAAKRTLDVAGHYGRPDIFKLEVNRERVAPVEFS